MLTDEQLRKAFVDTNTAEPLCEGWPGLERFAREVERLAWAAGYQQAISTYDDGDGSDA